MKLDDRLRRDLPRSVEGLTPSSASWNGVERGLVRHARRAAVARVALAVAVLGGFVGVLLWVASSYLRQTPSPRPLATTPPIQSSPSPLGGEAPGFNPSRVAFWSPEVGLAVGSAGPCAESCAGAIELTNDGGQSWHAVQRTEDAVADVATAGSSDGWAVVGSCREPGCDNLILKSDDGGQTWTELGPAPVYQIDFASGEIGWGLSVNAALSGAGGQPVARTVDGGRTWTETESPCPPDTPVPSSVDFVDPDDGWMACVGDAATSQQGKAIFETGDGGATWKPLAAVTYSGGAAGDLGITGHQPALAFRPDGQGWLWMDRDCLYASTDRGQSWTRTGTDICMPDVKFISDLQFFSDRDGVGLLLDGDASELQLIQSHDGGATWSVIHTWPLTR